MFDRRAFICAAGIAVVRPIAKPPTVFVAPANGEIWRFLRECVDEALSETRDQTDDELDGDEVCIFVVGEALSYTLSIQAIDWALELARVHCYALFEALCMKSAAADRLLLDLRNPRRWVELGLAEDEPDARWAAETAHEVIEHKRNPLLVGAMIESPKKLTETARSGDTDARLAAIRELGRRADPRGEREARELFLESRTRYVRCLAAGYLAGCAVQGVRG